MAAARKNYARTRGKHTKLPDGREYELACFIDDLLEGVIEATDVEIQLDGQGRFIRLRYNDPTG